MQPTLLEFGGADGNTLVASEFAADGASHGIVLLLHGGGQTRHSWYSTARALSARGWTAVSIDQRGHGRSEWVADGNYLFEAFARDLGCVLEALNARGGQAPVVVGASLGGIAGMLVAGGRMAPMNALILVDITPHVKTDGVERIMGFMAEKSVEGFACLEEAADAISAYLPHRPRPKTLSGLEKNLRRDADGRYRWRWDPRFLDSRRDAASHASEMRQEIVDAAREIRLPVLLVRGRESELVGEQEAAQFLELVPHAHVTDVSGARHMVAGDRNDVFSDAVLGFLDKAAAA